MLCRKRLHRRQGAGELLQRAGDCEARSRRGECDVSEPTELHLGTRVAGTHAHIRLFSYLILQNTLNTVCI